MLPSAKTLWLSAALIAATGAASVVFFSCGKSKSKSSDASPASSDGPDQLSTYATPATISVTSGSVAVPPQALDDGTRLKIAATDPPDQLKSANQSASGAAAASNTVTISATDTNGGAVQQTKAPMTVALDVSSGTTQALLAPLISADPSNICALGFGTDQKLRVWRRAVITTDPNVSTRMRFASQWLGSYQLFYCGALPIDGALEATADGTQAAKATGPQAFGSCKLTQADGFTQCQAYAGKSYADQTLLTTANSSCTAAKGTFGSGDCPDKDGAGSCVNDPGTTKERAVVFAPPAGNTASASSIAALKAACLATATNKWMDAGTLTLTPLAQQK